MEKMQDDPLLYMERERERDCMITSSVTFKRRTQTSSSLCFTTMQVVVVLVVAMFVAAVSGVVDYDDTRTVDGKHQPWTSRLSGNTTAAKERSRVNRILLPILTVIKFANLHCRVGSKSGTCYTARQCRERSGQELGACAEGFGVCCYKEITCGGTTWANGTYLVSPGYPSSYNDARTCDLTVSRTPGVCQLRLDFETFEIFPPDQFGHCITDQFTVDDERKFKFLCGSAPSDWHFYLDVAEGSGPTVLRIVTGASSFRRLFSIRVTMIECAQKVPGGCGQYLTGNSGVVQSFNYGGFYLAGLDYGICFRKEKNKCSTTLRVAGPSFVGCPNDLYRLPVGRSAAAVNNPLATLSLYCQLDTNFVPFASLATIQSPLTTVTRGPLVIWHRTDSSDAQPNYHSTAGCTACSGFYQTFIHNDC
ncbi:uncharacterized protein LOC123509799 isoform X2 [Portunus trituberculatus]|uniref:uncharacterized protein LOC123509799 isoform X2 n=1 Tax=Portunus trituberculatus TaxID=210409 RepID=UPI001E1CE459|nr:uncharacterized protein LOC123509799 isoform X2 [Portunus trituberculatus]